MITLKTTILNTKLYVKENDMEVEVSFKILFDDKLAEQGIERLKKDWFKLLDIDSWPEIRYVNNFEIKE